MKVQVCLLALLPAMSGLHQQQSAATETDHRDRPRRFQDDRDLPGRNESALPVIKLRPWDQRRNANVK